MTAAQSARQNARTREGKYAEFTSSEQGADLTAPESAPCRAFSDTPEVFTAKYETVQAKVEAFKAELDQAVAGLAEDENWIDYLQTMSKFHRYSATNQLLIAIQTSGRATKVAGFRAWQDKFNRSVNKGEKAISILAPKVVNMAKQDANGKKVMGPDGKPVKVKRIVGFTTASVFDVAQTSGDPLPSIEQELHEDPPEGFVDDMVTAAGEAGYTVEFREMESLSLGGAQGWSSPRTKEIVVDSSQTPASQAATLAHELGHVYAGHCDPDQSGQYHMGPGGCRGRMETEAESIAYTLGRANGMEMGAGKVSAQYVAGWSRSDPKVLRDAADTVSKSFHKIVTSTKFRNLDQD